MARNIVAFVVIASMGMALGGGAMAESRHHDRRDGGHRDGVRQHQHQHHGRSDWRDHRNNGNHKGWQQGNHNGWRDRNHDGRVDWRDQPGHVGRDRNHDGRVDWRDRDRNHDGRVDWRDRDRNHDGRVDWRDWRSWMQR